MKSLVCLICVILITLQSCKNVNNKKINFHFTEIETNTDASLRGLFVVDENVVWANGSKGTVLVSVNGGETWDKDRAMVFGVAGLAFGYLTENGGESWEVVFQDSTIGLF